MNDKFDIKPYTVYGGAVDVFTDEMLSFDGEVTLKDLWRLGQTKLSWEAIPRNGASDSELNWVVNGKRFDTIEKMQAFVMKLVYVETSYALLKGEMANREHEERDQEEIDFDLKAIKYCLYQHIVDLNWPKDLTIKFTRCLEHFDPDLEEEVALARMSKIIEKAVEAGGKKK